MLVFPGILAIFLIPLEYNSYVDTLSSLRDKVEKETFFTTNTYMETSS